MLLTVDIGNSNIKAALFEKDKIVNHFREPDLTKFISSLKNYSFDQAAICSVVPETTKSLTAKIKEEFDISPFIITKESKFNLKNEYKTPETLGLDRFCSAEGAFFLFKILDQFKDYKEGVYILTIDFGTATTINVIEFPGIFIGGLIAPGIEMMFDSLNKRTAQLPDVELSDFDSLIGKDTNSSIASGVVTSVVGMIEKTTNYLKKEKNAKNVFIYLTGGNVKKIVPHLNVDFVYEENLVLYGVNGLFRLITK